MRNDVEFTKMRHPATTITSGTTTNEINIVGGTLTEVYIPASIASATMKILKSDVTGGTFSAIYDALGTYTAAGDVTFTIAADKWVVIPPSLTAGLQFFKLEFDQTETSKTYKIAHRSIN